MNKTKAAGLILILISLVLFWNKYSPIIVGPPAPPAPPVVVLPPAPFLVEDGKLSMLVVDETDPTVRKTFTTAQMDAMLGTNEKGLRFYVESKSGPGHYLFLDQNVADKPEGLQYMPKWIQDAFKVKRDGPPPWVLASNGKTGFSKPLVSLEDTLKDVAAMEEKK